MRLPGFEDNETPTRLSVVDVAVRAVHDRILDGTLSPGTDVPEEGLSEALGISRVTARSAIADLVSQGYLVKKANRPAVVRRVSSASVHDVFRVRRPIELEALRMIKNKKSQFSDADFDSSLDDVATELERSEDQPQHVILHLNLEFHRRLIAGANNQWLLPAFAAIEPGIMLALAQTDFQPAAKSVSREHRKLLQSLRKLEWPDARDELIRHLKESERAVVKGLG